jgi:hypothetical protein
MCSLFPPVNSGWSKKTKAGSTWETSGLYLLSFFDRPKVSAG